MTYLLLDSNFLCHRAFHSMGNLQHGEVRTGMLYGFMRDVVALQDQFGTTDVIFCFDNGTSHRKALCPTYKTKRKLKDTNLSGPVLAIKDELYRQIDLLRDIYLPSIGYRNVLHAPNFESDDVIAKLCQHWRLNEADKIIISADADLHQCLSYNTRCYNPSQRVLLDVNAFVRKWGVQPTDWYEVKAMAGCGTDDIPGIRGVGEHTAAKYLAGKVKTGSKAHQSITSPAGQAIWQANRKLVRLPFKGTPEFQLRNDEVTDKRWAAFAEKFGMATLARAGRAGRFRGQQTQGFGL